MNTLPDDEDLQVQGDVIRFMWDYTVSVPLWDEDGKLPEDREWLRAALALSEELITDLEAWGEEMNRLDEHSHLGTSEAYADLDRRARLLVQRLQEEVGTRFRVVYKPW